MALYFDSVSQFLFLALSNLVGEHASPTFTVSSVMHAYEVRPRSDHRGVDLTSDVLPFGRLWYGEPNAVSNAIGYAMHYSRSHDAVIRVYDAAGNAIETHEHARDSKSGRCCQDNPERTIVDQAKNALEKKAAKAA